MTLDQILQRLEKYKSTVNASACASVNRNVSANTVTGLNYTLQKPSQYKNINSFSITQKL